MIINDGLTGDSARVTKQNELLVRSVTQTAEVVASIAGDHYTLGVQGVAPTLTIPLNFSGPVMLLRNFDTRLMRLAEVNGTIDGSAAPLLFNVLKNPTIGTLGANVVVDPINTNFSAGNTAAVIANIWDETGVAGITGITGGEILPTSQLVDGTFRFDSRGGFSLGTGDAIVVFGNGDGVGNVEFEISIDFFFENPAF